MKVENMASDAEDFTSNVWLLSNSENVLIDAGTGDSWEEISKLETVDKVVITHSHYDHLDNLPKVDDRFDPEIYSYKPENLPVDSKELEDGEKIVLCGSEFRTIHTPGHKDDSVCLYSETEKILFAGDLIFPGGSFGRTDLEEGDRDLLIESIEKISDLQVEELYSGHDPASFEDVNQQIEESLEQARKHQPKY